MTEPARSSPNHRALIKSILASYNRDKSAGMRNTVAFAISPTTEHLAYAYTEKYLAGLRSEIAKIGARRAAAMCAMSGGAPKFIRNPDDDTKYGKPVGASLRELVKKETGQYPEKADESTSLMQQVMCLPQLDVENAAIVLGNLLTRCGSAGVAVDFESVSNMLTFWGDGIGDDSTKVRQKLISDFYTSPDYSS